MSNIAVFLTQSFHARCERLPLTALALVKFAAALIACGDAGSSFDTDGMASPGGSQMPGGNLMSPGAGAPTGNMDPPVGTGAPTTGSPGTGETVGMNGVPVAPGTPTTPMGGGTPMADAPMAGDPPATDDPPVTEEPPPEACPTGPVCHEFFANDNFNNVVSYINEFDPTKNWRAPVGVTGVNSPRQVDLVDNPEVVGGPLNGKAVLVSINTGFQEYHPVTGERLLDVRLAGTSDIRGAVRLPDGNTILGVGNDTLRTVDRTGATVRSCTLPGVAGGDSLRALTRDPDGSILLGRNLDLFRVSDTCQQLWTARLPNGSKAYNVMSRLGGDGVWATSGGPSTVIEFDAQGQIARQIGGRAAHPNVTFDFFSGFKLLPNGNVVVANWQGYVANPTDSTPHLVEFSPDNQLVWRWGNQTLARQITNVLVLR